MNTETDGDDDEWEYEYSTTETETFYVDLDLSSINGVIRSQNSGDRKSLKRLVRPAVARSSGPSGPRNGTDVNTVDQGEQDGEDNDENVDGVDEEQTAESPTQMGIAAEHGPLDEDYTGRIQILDLHTTNPIVAYAGHVYSCSWHDMLGTIMFVTKHQEAPLHEPEISTDDYDLIGTTRIKLVGHRAKVIPKPESRKRGRDDEEGAEDLNLTGTVHQHFSSGKSLGTITRTNPKTNIDIKQQASFLEKLMELKKSRGETDIVRTYVDRRTGRADARQAQRAKLSAKAKPKANAANKDPEKEDQKNTELRLRREINELNKRVVQGDNQALIRLQEIYADMEEAEDEEAEFAFTGRSGPAAFAEHQPEGNDDTADEPRTAPKNNDGR